MFRFGWMIRIKFLNFCQQSNLPSPKVWGSWLSPAELNLSELPDEFVLKPNVLHSAQGVMVLSKQKDGKYFESLERRTLTTLEIQEEQVRLWMKASNKEKYRLLAEEKIVNEGPDINVPYDYKIFCFYGIPTFISQYDRNAAKKSVCFWDGEFRPLNLNRCIRSEWKHLNKGEHILPTAWQEMLSIASKVSKLVKTPFIRVDMFASSRGPLIGELTPAPGTPYYGVAYGFKKQFNQELGDAWEDAIERMKLDQ